MKQLGLVLLACAVLISFSCTTHTSKPPYAPPTGPGYTVPNPAMPVRHQVAMTDYRFNPESLNVAVGDTVTWTNRGTVPHTTTSGKNGTPDHYWDANVDPGRSFSHVFTQAGTYPYYCTPHFGMGMKGVVVVTAR